MIWDDKWINVSLLKARLLFIPLPDSLLFAFILHKYSFCYFLRNLSWLNNITSKSSGWHFDFFTRILVGGDVWTVHWYIVLPPPWNGFFFDIFRSINLWYMFICIKQRTTSIIYLYVSPIIWGLLFLKFSHTVFLTRTCFC